MYFNYISNRSAATATAASQPETPINAQQPILCENLADISQPAEASENFMTTTVTSQRGSPQINTSHLLICKTVAKSCKKDHCPCFLH